MKKKSKKRQTAKTWANAKTDFSWPGQKGVFFRPERYRYVKKLDRSDSCVFCEGAGAEPNFSSLVVYRNTSAFVMLNKYPYNTGHLLVVPHRHVGDLDSLSDEEFFDLQVLLRKSGTILKRAYSCEGMNIGMNWGKIAGAGIPDHLHWHLVPRWLGDTNFFPLLAGTKVLPETLEQTYERLIPYFKD